MSREFSFIKPFRALAAFWVISAHAFQWWVPDLHFRLLAPKMAVDLFMIISGYLMTANAFARYSFEPLTESQNWLRFWLRRFFRVAPAYYAVLTLVILSSGPFLGGYQHLIHMAFGNSLVGSDYDPDMVRYSASNVLMHVTFLYGMFPEFCSSTYLPDWTLGLEMQFYFVFPFFFLVLRRFGFARPAILIGFPVFLAGLYLSRHIHFPEPSLLLMKLNYFIAGAVLYRVLAGGLSRLHHVGMSLLAVALVSVDYRYHWDLLALPTLMSLMLLLGQLELKGRTPAWATAIIESRLIKMAADTSYSVYLFHGFFIAASGYIVAANSEFVAAHGELSTWLMYVFVLTGSYALANVVYRLIELPGIALGKRVIARLPRHKVADDSGATKRLAEILPAADVRS